MAKNMDLSTKRRFIEAPERKRFGWSPYLEEILHISFPKSESKVMAQEATVRGKKLCLFGKFIWDYQMEIVNYKKFVKS